MCGLSDCEPQANTQCVHKEVNLLRRWDEEHLAMALLQVPLQ